MRDELVISVSELLQNPGSQRRLTFQERVEGLGIDLVRVEPDEPLDFDLVLEAVDGESVHVKGEVRGRFVVTCRRCLVEEPRSFAARVSEVFRPEHDAWDEGYVVKEGCEIDLSGPVSEAVILEMPVNPLCTEDCAGLCPTCGVNLNQDACACVPEQGDERWGPLRDLLQG